MSADTNGNIHPQLPLHLNIQLNGDAALRPMILAARCCVEVMSVGCAAISSTNLNKLPVEKSDLIRITFDEVPASEIDNHKTALSMWLIKRAFEGLVHGIREALEQVYLYLRILHHPFGPMTLEEFQQLHSDIIQEGSRPNFLQLVDKIGILLGYPLPYAHELSSLQKVRNCIIHRYGVVGTSDVTAGTGALQVHVPTLKMFLTKDGEEREIRQGAYVTAGTSITIKLATAEWSYSLGSKVELSQSDLKMMAIAVSMIADLIKAALPTKRASGPSNSDTGK